EGRESERHVACQCGRREIIVVRIDSNQPNSGRAATGETTSDPERRPRHFLLPLVADSHISHFPPIPPLNSTLQPRGSRRAPRTRARGTIQYPMTLAEGNVGRRGFFGLPADRDGKPALLM